MKIVVRMSITRKILAFAIISWMMSQEIITNFVSSTQVSKAAPNIDLELISEKCSTKLDFKSIREFQDFMTQFVTLDEKIDLPEPIKICLSHKEALVDLKDLVDNYDKKRACKHSEVLKLDNYARKHFMVNKKQRPWSLKFFTLFGVNIGLKCKLNLLAHLKQADNEVDQIDFIYSMASPTGWNILINEHTKKTMTFGTSSNAGNTIINRVSKLVPGLSSVDQLDFMIFDHPMNELTMTTKKGWTGGIENDTYQFISTATSALSVNEAQQVHEFLTKIVESCQNLDQFYYNSILSLARLNSLGLLVNFKLLDEMHESSLMLHRWLAAASFCQIMVRVQIDRLHIDGTSQSDFKAGEAQTEETQFNLNLNIIHDDSLLESRRTLYSYVAQFDEISEEARANVWMASVLDGKWLRKDGAIFKSDSSKSVAMLRLNQFIRGLERDYTSWIEKNKSY